MSKELDEKVAAFNERMKVKKVAEEEKEAQTAEQRRQDYLKRTGRTEMKP